MHVAFEKSFNRLFCSSSNCRNVWRYTVKDLQMMDMDGLEGECQYGLPIGYDDLGTSVGSPKGKCPSCTSCPYHHHSLACQY